jgi:23S rRNA pseudouridine2605 synthase
MGHRTGVSMRSANEKIQGTVPLYRALSKLGIASRTQTREWIAAGEIRVDGRICRDPEFLVSPETAVIDYRDTTLHREPTRVVLLNKTRGTITSRHDEQGRPTVYSLLPPALHHLHCVGRLDWASSGLLLLTNNTRFSSRLTDPVQQIPRVYVVTVRGLVTPETAAAMQQGIVDDADLLRADAVDVRKSSRRESHLVITLTEGKNREIRRLCKIRGHEVTRLKRVAFGGLTLGNLAPGEYRELGPDEIENIVGVQKP